MARLLTFQLTNRVYYLLPSDPSPAFYRVSDTIEFANPILSDAHHGNVRNALRVPSGEVWFGSDMVTLRLSSDFSMSTGDEPHELLDPFLTKLRLVSRQAKISRAYVCLSFRENDSLSETIIHIEENEETEWMVPSGFPTAITRVNLESLSSEPRVDYVHESLLLDAFAAYWASDFRSCLIYSAFSIEAAAGRWLTDRHAIALAEKSTHLRVRTLQANKQAPIIVKDDIWDHLASVTRDICKQLFHLRPMYLVQRSLMVENQPLYSRIERLFTTRNSIVHSDSKPNIYPSTRASAEEALHTVVQVLKWLTLPADFILPTERFKLDRNGLTPWRPGR